MNGSTLAIFEPGQTLTHTELNLTTNFLDRETQRLGRAVGFGIGCGLTGTVEDKALLIGPGRAVDQLGRPIEVGVGLARPTYPLSSGLSVGGSLRFDRSSLDEVLTDEDFDFLDPNVAGRTAILRVIETDEATPSCPESGCERHATIRCRQAEIVFARGRLMLPIEDPARRDLLDLGPVTMDEQGRVGSAAHLRDKLLAVLDRPLKTSNAENPAKADKVLGILGGLSFKQDEPRLARARRASLVNHVLYLTLVFLRCRDATRRTAVIETATPGVALGFVQFTGTTLKWDCTYRHDWVLPERVLADAMGAGRCGDPCDRLLRRIEAEILAHVEPSEGEALPHIDNDHYQEGGTEFLPINPGCEILHDFTVVAGLIRDELDRLESGDLGQPPGADIDPLVLATQYLRTDVVEGAGLIGWGAERARANLETTLQRTGVADPRIEVISESDVATFDGFVIGTESQLGDRIVLVQNGNGMVVGMGKVPLAATIGRNGAAIAELPATTARVDALDTGLGELRVQTAPMAGFMVEIEQHRAQLGLNTFGETIQALATTAPEFGALETSLRGISADVTVMEQQLDSVEYEARFATNRVVDIALQHLRPADTGLDSAHIDGLVDVMETMAEATKVLATTDRQREQVAAVLERLDQPLAGLRAAATGAVPVAAGVPLDVIVDILDAMAGALRAAGVTSAQLRDTNRAIESLRSHLR